MTPNTRQAEESIVPAKLNNRFYLMRHGQSLANEIGLIVCRPENAISQYGLTPTGRLQVCDAITASTLSSAALIVSSDYARARETAEIAYRILKTGDIESDTRLRERSFGDWELKDHSAYTHIWELDLLQTDEPQNNVEPVASVLKRTLDCIMDLDARFDSRQIVLVGHGDVLQIALAHFAGIQAHRHRSLKPLKNAEIRLLVSI
jgi:probable phosphoglycerate mutase